MFFRTRCVTYRTFVLRVVKFVKIATRQGKNRRQSRVFKTGLTRASEKKLSNLGFSLLNAENDGGGLGPNLNQEFYHFWVFILTTA